MRGLLLDLGRGGGWLQNPDRMSAEQWREFETVGSRWRVPGRLARMIKNHWEGVINAATSDVTNARAEAINSRIQ